MNDDGRRFDELLSIMEDRDDQGVKELAISIRHSLEGKVQDN